MEDKNIEHFSLIPECSTVCLKVQNRPFWKYFLDGAVPKEHLFCTITCTHIIYCTNFPFFKVHYVMCIT